MEDALVLVLAGIPIAVNVLLTVQGLKVFGLVDGKNAAKAAIGAALFFGLGAAAVQLFPAAATYIALASTTFVGAMTAGLFYEYLAKPFLGKFEIPVTTVELK